MRKLKRYVAALSVTAAAVIGSAPAAGAADYPWYPFDGIKSNWTCSDTVKQDRAYIQQCVIVSGIAYQGATIITTNTSVNAQSYTSAIKNRVSDGRVSCAGTISDETVLCLSETLRAAHGSYVQGAAEVIVGATGPVWHKSPTVPIK
ncbi:hypothetical protein C9F11_02805 [Streptomyces sp. YIM 121038]|uniref:hypothetical protein n=1 Tax=Streptomyces sp. YIM 121038 TaxID=2136401 RepID=UPI00111020AB|nr:hypothetical protein [Streptomyces sp. YIM 121038]QCX74264.1 hypothetical protein C9F11_02805 [Streptomyces sp. YIM 121038]